MSLSQPAERRERSLDVVEIGRGDEAAAERLPCCLSQQVGGQSLTRAVVERSSRIGHGDRAEPGAIRGRYVRVMKHDVAWHAEAAASPSHREREVHMRGEHVREFEEGERGLVRDNPDSCGPEIRGDEFLVFRGREVNEPVDAVMNPGHPSRVEVVDKQLGGVPCVGRLLSREETFLRHSCFE